MPEIYPPVKQWPSVTISSRSPAKGRPKSNVYQTTADWLTLPYEIWLEILTCCDLAVKDLVNLELTCSYFKGYGITEEAARLIIKWHRKPRFGQMDARIEGSWKMRLYTFNQLLSHSTQLASGSYQNVFSYENRVFTWGAGRFGQLGNNCQNDCATPSDITSYVPPEMGKVVQVSASSAHTAVLTDRGMALTFGDSRYNQLGQANRNGSLVPLLVKGSLTNVHCVQVACGSSHTMMLSDTGQVFVTGKGDTGQLGLGRSVKMCHGPTLLPVSTGIKYIAAGIAHNVLITDDGCVCTFGSGTGGQLGLGGTKDVYKPSMIVANFHNGRSHEVITSVAAGVDHTLFLNNKGRVFACGRNRDGTLGLGHTKITVVPQPIKNLDNTIVDNIVAGVATSVFIDKQGHAYWCGQGIGGLEEQTAMVPTKLNFPERLKSVSIGDDHMIIQTRTGKLFSMGANTRGQTGHNTNGLPVKNFMEIIIHK